jgi:hypothetical protein
VLPAQPEELREEGKAAFIAVHTAHGELQNEQVSEVKRLELRSAKIRFAALPAMAGHSRLPLLQRIMLGKMAIERTSRNTRE